MKLGWKKYLAYAGIAIFGGSLLLILIQTVRAKNTGFEVKTLWDWMDLLVVPLVLAGGALFLNRSERNTEREIATDRQQEAALQAYIDKISELLLKEKLRTTRKAEVRNVARTRTISVMRGLDTRRVNLVIQFLREANLIQNATSILKEAHMEGINLQDAILYQVNLLGAHLPEANLQGASLYKANLQNAHLFKVNLQGAFLMGTNLQDANLLQANLQDAYLLQANLEGANLQGAKVTNRELGNAKSLKGATMPDGTKHE